MPIHHIRQFVAVALLCSDRREESSLSVSLFPANLCFKYSQSRLKR
jgi:hypothetical protein